MIYLEIVLLITVIVTLLRQTTEKIKLEDQVKDIEDKLEGIKKVLVELQPKSPVEIPVRLPNDAVNEMIEITKREMEEYQLEKAEFQKMMKKIKEEYSDDKDTQYEGTEYGSADRFNREQVQEILANIAYRKKNKLK